MTSKEMLTAIINGGEITTEIKDKAKEMLAALDKKTESRSKKSAENASANLELAKSVTELMESRTYGASEIVTLAKNNGIELNTSKVGHIFKVASENGLIESIDNYKVGGKGRAVKGYKAIK